MIDEEDVTERIRLMAELAEDGRKQCADILLSAVPKIKIEVGYMSRPRVRDVFDVPDDP